MNARTPSQMARFEAAASDIDAMHQAIALGLALGQSESQPLITGLREIGAVECREIVTLKLGAAEGGLLLRPDGVATPVYEPAGRTITLDQVRAEKPLLMTELTAACERTWPSAFTVLRPLFEPARMPTRQEFTDAANWAPLLTAVSYRLATRSIGVVEALRDDALRSTPSADDPAAEALVCYHSVLLSSAHLLLLASPPGGRPWFADMAKTFTWMNWTPTISLVRERTLWLTAAAVRSTAAFGPEVIALYDDALARAVHPVTAFDALLGLVSIACSYERSFDEIARRIEAAHALILVRDDPYLLFTDRAFRSARIALQSKRKSRDPFAAIENLTGWRGATSQTGFATPRTLRLDPLDPVETGEMVGLLAVPAILEAPVADHYPAQVRDNAKLLPAASELVDILHRAWAPRRRTMH